MRRGRLLWGLVATLPAAGAGTSTPAPERTGHGFDTIRQRNLFGLQPPIVQTVTKPAPPLARLILTGITTILGKR